MFRSVWIVISTMAIANLLALVGFGAWLAASNRFSNERLERVRTMFAVTVAQEQAEAAAKADAERAAAEAAAAAAQVGTPPLTAEQKLRADAETQDVELQLARRTQRETADLIETLMREREELERSRDEFQRQVAEFNEMRRRIAEEEGSEQFRKTVQLYQSVKAAEARNMMASLIAGGQIEQVVAYLNALATRTSSKIIAEFQKDDPALAADLLERLRTRGTTVAMPESAGTAPAANQPATAAAAP